MELTAFLVLLAIAIVLIPSTEEEEEKPIDNSRLGGCKQHEWESTEYGTYCKKCKIKV